MMDEDISEIIKRVAKKLDCIVVATGKIDTITDGKKVIKINNGTTKLKSVTGTGCMTASLIGSYLGASENKLNAVAMGVLTMSLSGELADKDDMPIGTFKVNLMDNIFNMSEEKLRKYGKVE